MKANLLSLIAATLLLGIAVQGQTPNQSQSLTWKQYTISHEDFSVALPLLPARHTTYEFLEAIQKHRIVYSLGAYADGVVYVVYVYENPLRQSLDSFVEAHRGGNSTATELNLSGFSGRQIVGENSKSQYFATKDRLFLFQAMGAPGDDPRTAKFFASVVLRDKKDSVEVDDGPGLPYEPPGETQPVGIDGTPKIFTGKEVYRKVRLAMKPEPRYTEAARQNEIAGTVVLKVVFASNGSVTNIMTVSGLPYGLTERAIDAARKIKFIPAMKDGKFVSMWMQLEYNFNLY